MRLPPRALPSGLMACLEGRFKAQMPRVWDHFFFQRHPVTGTWDIYWVWGGHGVQASSKSSQLPARLIEDGGEMSQGRGAWAGVRSSLVALRIPRGPPSGVTKTDLAWNMAAVSQACHQGALCLVRCGHRWSQGHSRGPVEQAASPKMQFFFLFSPVGVT